jgi:hypothetical protein
MNVLYIPSHIGDYSIKSVLRIGAEMPKNQKLTVYGNDDLVQDITKLVKNTNDLKLQNLTFVLNNNIVCQHLTLHTCDCSLENIFKYCKNLKSINIANCIFLHDDFTYITKLADSGCVITFYELCIDAEVLECANDYCMYGDTTMLCINKNQK